VVAGAPPSRWAVTVLSPGLVIGGALRKARCQVFGAANDVKVELQSLGVHAANRVWRSCKAQPRTVCGGTTYGVCYCCKKDPPLLPAECVGATNEEQ
jgi:hypothetical protein